MTDTLDPSAATAPHIGERRLRKEDPALLTGEARFVDDLVINGALWLGVVCSPHASARIVSIDTAEAAALPGVVAVHTGEDLQDAYAPLPCAWPVTEDMKNPPHLPLAVGHARFQGDAVAVVVADSREAAADAIEAVVVQWEPRPAVVDLQDSASDRVVVHEDLGTNTAYTWELTPDADAVEQAFAGAAHTVSERYVQQRLLPSAMEPRGVAVIPEPFGGGVTIYSATQIPHILKVMLALTCSISESKIRVIAPSVGGGFGCKLNVYAEEVLCMVLARKHGRPVRWTEERSEAATATIQGRGQLQHIELAADEDGRIKGVRVKLIADMGAYMQLVTPGIPLLGAFLYSGVYDIPAYSFVCQGVFTNMTPTDAYRGAGRPEATFAIERAVDALAAKLGLDPAEIRRRNFIRPEQFPYASASGLSFDSGQYELGLDKALAKAGYDDLRAEQARRRQALGPSGPSERGTRDKKHLGIGIATYVEMCGLAPSRVLAALRYSAGGWESSTVRVLPTGKVEVLTGTSPHGQGHVTCWSQIVADQLGVDPDDVEVLHSDTAISPLGMDTYGSRSLSVGGAALVAATDKVVAKARTIAAHQLEAAEDDLEFAGGTFTVKGSPDKSAALGAIAFAAFTAHDLPDGLEPNLEAQATWDPPNFTFPNGAHICVVEVDEETGSVELQRYVAVDDCGTPVNPMIIDGQLHGGIAQGIGQALFEEAVYDGDGQLRSATLADYLVPSAPDLPSFELDNTVTPSPSNQLGVKGIGEAGTIGSAAAVINAIVDALRPLGVTDVRMPASPARVWAAITGGQADVPATPGTNGAEA